MCDVIVLFIIIIIIIITQLFLMLQNASFMNLLNVRWSIIYV